ncbi:MAG: cohesin domain-containing protein [Candidatus Krumholzibacteria bacterium]|nr:cohesin domain-containing protein [Candidatus Krumholzibacteria bacterium]
MKAMCMILAIACSLLVTSCGKDSPVAPKERASISISPAECSVSVGGTVTMAVNVGAAKNLFAATFDLLFDEAKVSAAAVSIPPSGILGTGSTLAFSHPIVGGVSVGIGRVRGEGNAGVSGSGALLQVTFVGLAAGSTGINIKNIQFLDDAGKAVSITRELDVRGATIVVQ